MYRHFHRRGDFDFVEVEVCSRRFVGFRLFLAAGHKAPPYETDCISAQEHIM